jgi:hypothetical protein
MGEVGGPGVVLEGTAHLEASLTLGAMLADGTLGIEEEDE